MESTQHELDHIRPPRVHITYDVEIGDAVEVVELPFVVGVMADLSGSNNASLPAFKQRKFVEMTNQSFTQVLQASKPAVTIVVPNVIKNDGSTLPVALTFNSMDDFGPVAIAQQVPELAALYQKRQRLSELLSRVAMSDQLNNLLETVATDQQQLDTLKQLVGPATTSTPSSGAASSGSDPKPSSTAPKS